MNTDASPITPQYPLILLAVALFFGGFQWISSDAEGLQPWMFLLGGSMGIALYHASFGFTTAWRRFISERRGSGLRGQMIMLAVAVCLFFPVLAEGSLFGHDARGFVRPLGFSVLVGAFIFGIGMQIGNGCASGNLFHSGGGQIRALPAMIGFAAGGLWATADYEWWTTLPQLTPFSFIEWLGPFAAILMNVAIFGLIALLTVVLEKRRHGALEQQETSTNSLLQRLLSGPWPYIWGAVALALMNFATLAAIGRPWSVAVAYPLWGAKAAQWFELDLDFDFWSYWLQPGRESALYEPLTQDMTSVMNIGILLGAFLAASLAGRFSLQWRMPWQHWLASVIGGVMLGYGATIAFGCNIGAYFSGIASGSLHGWLWLVAAFAGSMLGSKLRPLFRLP